MESKIVDLGSGQWASQDMINEMEKFHRRRETYIWLFSKPEHSTIRKERKELKGDYKWCYVLVGHTRKLAMINQLDNKVYKVNNMELTNVEIKNYRFDRYCTSFDL